ncbi:MAG: transposase [Gammaproteobacteria bacterium]|nr:transposase [Gammaproteobacteria bacterium]
MKTCETFKEELVRFNSEGYHVHVLLNHTPKVALSNLINYLQDWPICKLKQLHPKLKNWHC